MAFTSLVIRVIGVLLYTAILASADTLSRPLAFSNYVQPPTFHEAAVSALQSQQYHEALHFLDKASAELLNTIGVTHKMMGNYDAALDSFMSAIRLTDGFHAHYNAANLLHFIMYEKDEYNKHQVLDNAILLYDKALIRAMDGQEGVTNSIKAQMYIELGEALRKGNRISESTAALIKAAELDSSHVHNLGNTAVMLFNDGYMDDAWNAASAAVALDPTHPVFRRNYEALILEMEQQKLRL